MIKISNFEEYEKALEIYEKEIDLKDNPEIDEIISGIIEYEENIDSALNN